jgi:hypothetical protein
MVLDQVKIAEFPTPAAPVPHAGNLQGTCASRPIGQGGN